MIKPMLTSPKAHRLALCGLALTLLVSAGCARSPQRSYYSLQSPAPQPTRGEAFTPSVMNVVLGPVTLPDSVDRQQIVTRSGDNRLDISDLHRWAQPLSGAIAAVLADDLYRALGKTTLVGIQGQETAASDPDYRIAIDIRRFEAVLGQSASVEAAWIIRRKHAERPLRGQSLAREPVRDASYDALASAYARALGRISRDIAASLYTEPHG